MKTLYKLFGLFVAIIIMQGCATHQKFVNKYNSWVGKDIHLLIQQIGYPDSTYYLQNKNKVYVYEKSRIYSVPGAPIFGYGYGYYGGYGYGMYGYTEDIVYSSCKLFLETDKKGIIVRWGSRGNSCTSYYEKP